MSGFEDIHSLVENKLIEFIGEQGKKLHTARSRNDQIVTDERLYAKQVVADLVDSMVGMQKNLVSLAEKSRSIVIPAYTHMQKAQPVLAAHYLLSFTERFSRDIKSLFASFETADSLPLGAAACVGSGYDLDRELVADLLKFSTMDNNFMDTVSSRDFMLDIIYACSKIMLHLSRICEDFIIYASQEFSYIEIDDAFCTGSSIMPQKKNPDVLELIRGKSACGCGQP
ncbi:MAG: argininosuccinate lyase [Actinomycetota bacterium]|nr:argininosuccinate lyase [Actinomycetota bacterium]